MNMNSSNRWFRQNLTKIAAVLIVAVLFIQAREPRISASERSALASRFFHFVRYTLPDSTTAPSKTVRAMPGAIAPFRIPAAAVEVARLKQA